MEGAGEAWPGRMLHKPAQVMIQVPISSLGNRKGQTGKWGILSSTSALTVGESWAVKLPLTYQSLVGYEDDEEVSVKEPEQFSTPKRDGQGRIHSESWEEIT